MMIFKRRTHFCNWFLRAVHDGVLDPKHKCFSDEALFCLNVCINTQKNMFSSSINSRQTFELPLHNQKFGMWCAITAT
jgi:hypothetical protein